MVEAAIDAASAVGVFGIRSKTLVVFVRATTTYS